MRATLKSQAGTTLIEVTLAMAVLTVGALGAAGVFTSGMQKATSSPGDLIVTQKAQEAIESVFAARDSHKVTWAQIRNVYGESGSDGGIFLDEPQQLKDPGADGLVNTVDDGAVEEVRYPGKDRIMRTADDTFITLGQFRREIKITQLTTNLRVITVNMSYMSNAQTRTFSLTTYISNVS